jgi:predicted N-acetyltransferase YhbS
MNELIDRTENRRLPLIVLLGDPEYYSRFGFEPSSNYGIRYEPVGEDNPHFLVRPTGSFSPSLRGRLRYCWELSDPEAHDQAREQ